MNSDGLTNKDRNKIINLCKAIFPDASVWVYGSRARGDFRENSDIDLALKTDKKLDFFEVAELKDILSATSLPYKFDIVDLNSLSDTEFIEQIEKEKKLWKN